MESEKYIRNGIPLPALEVIDNGALKGYVSVNRLWSGFSGDDYTEASQSVYEDEIDKVNVLTQDPAFSLDGYEIVSSQFFSTSYKPKMSISRGKVKFNSTCLKKFQNVEYVELLINSVEKCIAVRPCDKDNPNSIRWGRLQNSKWVISPKSCSGFAGPLYDIMNWEADCDYRICGQYYNDGEDQMILFNLADPEIIKYELEINEEDTEIINDVEDEKQQNIKKTNVIRAGWGRSADTVDCFFFKEKRYKGNWDILQPTRIYRICGDIAEETLQQIKNEAFALLEKFRCQMA